MTLDTIFLKIKKKKKNALLRAWLLPRMQQQQLRPDTKISELIVVQLK